MVSLVAHSVVIAFPNQAGIIGDHTFGKTADFNQMTGLALDKPITQMMFKKSSKMADINLQIRLEEEIDTC